MNEIASQIVDIFEEQPNHFADVNWHGYYTKYSEEILAFSETDSMFNFPVSNLVSTDLTDDRYTNAQKLKPFYSWLGERVALCMNLQKGKTNEQLKEELAKLN